jgi:hypothetical protein
LRRKQALHVDAKMHGALTERRFELTHCCAPILSSRKPRARRDRSRKTGIAARPHGHEKREPSSAGLVVGSVTSAIERRAVMGFGKGALLWLLGIPLPIILLLALFWR